jgi:pimeloyl-ACP methyl ester carboxylesterase
MADDVGALLAHLKIDRADVFGYSMGGNVALALAIKHPQRVRKLATYGSNAGKIDLAYEAEAARQFKNLPPDFAPPPLKSLYDAVAPNPQDWPRLIAMVKQMGLEFSGFSNDKLKSVKAQVLVAVGDRDVVRPEHAVEMFRQMPNAQLCVVPGADHFLPFQDPQRLLKVIEDFLATPVVAPPAGAVPKP